MTNYVSVECEKNGTVYVETSRELGHVLLSIDDVDACCTCYANLTVSQANAVIVALKSAVVDAQNRQAMVERQEQAREDYKDHFKD